MEPLPLRPRLKNKERKERKERRNREEMEGKGKMDRINEDEVI